MEYPTETQQGVSKIRNQGGGQPPPHKKEETLIETQGSKDLKIDFSSYLAKEYGYKRKCDAVRSMKRHQKLNKESFEMFPNWVETAEIVEINL